MLPSGLPAKWSLLPFSGGSLVLADNPSEGLPVKGLMLPSFKN